MLMYETFHCCKWIFFRNFRKENQNGNMPVPVKTVGPPDVEGGRTIAACSYEGIISLSRMPFTNRYSTVCIISSLRRKSKTHILSIPADSG